MKSELRRDSKSGLLIEILRIRYTTIVVYYPPRNFNGVYGWMDVCIKKKSGLRQDGTPPQKMEQVWRCEVLHRLRSNFSPLHAMLI